MLYFYVFGSVNEAVPTITQNQETESTLTKSPSDGDDFVDVATEIKEIEDTLKQNELAEEDIGADFIDADAEYKEIQKQEELRKNAQSPVVVPQSFAETTNDPSTKIEEPKKNIGMPKKSSVREAPALNLSELDNAAKPKPEQEPESTPFSDAVVVESSIENAVKITQIKLQLPHVITKLVLKNTDDFTKIAQNSAMRFLSIIKGPNDSNNELSIAGAKLIAAAIVQNKLEELKFNGIILTKIVLTEILDAIAYNSSLRKLSICNANLTKDRTEIFKKIDNHKGLTALDLRGNEFDFEKLIYVIANIETIDTLGLSHTNVGEEITMLRLLLETNQLRDIDLSHNNLTNGSVSQLFSTQGERITRLQKINLSANQFGSPALLDSEEFFKANYGLNLLDLTGNKLGKAGDEFVERLMAYFSRFSHKPLTTQILHTQTEEDILTTLGELKKTAGKAINWLKTNLKIKQEDET